jgi:hypothetical protein
VEGGKSGDCKNCGKTEWGGHPCDSFSRLHEVSMPDALSHKVDIQELASVIEVLALPHLEKHIVKQLLFSLS